MDADVAADVDAWPGEPAPGPSPSPLGRLRAHRPYWLATMHQIGAVRALTLSVLSDGYRLDWHPSMGTPPRCWLRNHPSASAHATFVAEKIAEGVAAGTMHVSSAAELHCILAGSLGVAVNSAG